MQVFLTVAAVFAIMANFKEPIGEAVLLGFLVSLSSTAIVLRIIQKREEFDSLHGRTTLGILIFQDIAVVPMMLMIPMLPGAVQSLSDPPMAILAKGLALIAFIIISAKWLVPQALYHIAKTEDREIFPAQCGCHLLLGGLDNIPGRTLSGPRSFSCRTHNIGISLQPPGHRKRCSLSGRLHQLLLHIHRHAPGYRPLAP